MSIKVSNDRLELKINPFNNPDYIATFVNNKTIDYISQDSLSSLMNLREYINGLTLKNYGNRLIINEGSFFDTEDNKLYVFNKPTTKTLKFADESEIDLTSGEILFESDVPQTIQKFLPSGFYIITLVGAGGGGAGTQSSNSSASSAGASGSAYQCKLYLAEGNYTLTVGAGGEARYGVDMNAIGGTGGSTIFKLSDNEIISTPGGFGGHSWWRSGAEAAKTGGLTTVTNFTIEEEVFNLNGVSGSYGANGGYKNGGTPMFENYGKGGDSNTAGSNTVAYAGSSGYMKIEYFNTQSLGINVTYNVYYDFVVNDFIYTNVEPTNKSKWIGRFKATSSQLSSYFPTEDLIESFENHFIIAESLGTIGYRIYSDGWKEQWGNNVNPVFPVAFENIPVITTVGATNITTTGMTITAGYWQAEGY